MATRELRPIRVEGNIAYVPLTQGYEAIIDAADVPLVAGFNWTARVDRRAAGSVRTVYAMRRSTRAGGRQGLIHLHRVLIDVPEHLHVDHVDGNGLNNRKCNLRVADAVQNAQNRRVRSDNVSGVKGVSFHRVTGKWAARIAVDGRERHLGLFNCVTAAAIVYAKASRDLHGEFGRVA